MHISGRACPAEVKPKTEYYKRSFCSVYTYTADRLLSFHFSPRYTRLPRLRVRKTAGPGTETAWPHPFLRLFQALVLQLFYRPRLCYNIFNYAYFKFSVRKRPEWRKRSPI
jgi:hypothetical protein